MQVMPLAEVAALPVHYLADLFPMLKAGAGSHDVDGDPTLTDLAESILANGVRQPLVLWQGQLLDGRNRLAAAKLAGVADVPVTEFEGTDDEADQFVLDANLDRRNLTPAQRAEIAVSFWESEPRRNRWDASPPSAEGVDTAVGIAERLAARFRVGKSTIERLLKVHRTLTQTDSDGNLTPQAERAAAALRQVKAGTMGAREAAEAVSLKLADGLAARPGNVDLPNPKLSPFDRVENAAGRALDAVATFLEQVQAFDFTTDPFATGPIQVMADRVYSKLALVYERLDFETLPDDEYDLPADA